MKTHTTDSDWPNRGSEKNYSSWMLDTKFKEKLFCDTELKSKPKTKIYYKKSVLSNLLNFFSKPRSKGNTLILSKNLDRKSKSTQPN